MSPALNRKMMSVLDELEFHEDVGVLVLTGEGSACIAGIINSETVMITESSSPCSYDAGKKIKGRKRHIVTDTAGNMLEAIVHQENIQDRGVNSPYFIDVKVLIWSDTLLFSK